MTDTTTAADLIKLLRNLQTRIGPRMPGADEPEDRAQWKAIDRACLGLAVLESVSLRIIAPNDAENTLSVVRWAIETPAGWVGACDKAALEYLLAARAKEGKA